jgi:UDP-2,3-diacylglucosamine pyrophosphatase LpxH
MQTRGDSKLVYRSIWLSDIHLGFRHCKADYLLEFLSRTECKTLYVVGDLIDLWNLRRQWHWPSKHSEVLQQLLAKAENGTEVIYVVGNHDELFRQFHGHHFGRIRIERQADHVTTDGRRLLVTHGDEFEHAIRIGRFTKLLGCLSYDLLLMVNRLYNGIRRWRGQPYYSLAAAIKKRVRNAREAIDAFEQAAVHYAQGHDYDGIVCGHIHVPEIRHFGKTLYCNDGDWVENCTSLVERIDGGLELLHWADMRHSCKSVDTIGGPVQDVVTPLEVA